jgi:hypothetical protein
MDEKRLSQLLAGVLLIGGGMLLGAEQFLHWPSLDPSRLWPIIVIGVGANNLGQGLVRGDGKAGWGVSMMIMGTVLLLHFEHVASMRTTWPLFIVAQGIGLVLEGAWRARRRRAAVSKAADEVGAAARNVAEVRDGR